MTHDERMDRIAGMKSEIRTMIAELEDFYGIGCPQALLTLQFYEGLAVLEQNKATGTKTVAKHNEKEV